VAATGRLMGFPTRPLVAESAQSFLKGNPTRMVAIKHNRFHFFLAAFYFSILRPKGRAKSAIEHSPPRRHFETPPQGGKVIVEIADN